MKVAIVGGAPSTEYMAPFNNEEWDIWVLGNQLDRHLNRRVTKVFEIHDDLSEHDPRYPQWLVDHSPSLVVGDRFPLNDEKIETYPRDSVNSIFGCEMLSSSPAYMMGYAIVSGYDEIAIYGVDMAVDDHEYFKQRPEMYAWIAYAKAKGIKVTIPDESTLFKGGYDEGRDWGKGRVDTPFSSAQFLEMASQHRNKREEIDKEILNLKMKLNAHAGAEQAYERMAKVARGLESGAMIQNIKDSAVVK